MLRNLLRILIRVDIFVLCVHEYHARKIQRKTGINNFLLAKILAVVMFVLDLVFVVIYCRDRFDNTSAFSFLAVIATILSVKMTDLNENDFYISKSPINPSAISAKISMIRLTSLFHVIAFAVMIPFRSGEPEFKFLFFVVFVWTICFYLSCCTPLPPRPETTKVDLETAPAPA